MPVWSKVIGPPESPSVAGSAKLRSGLISCQDCPPFVDFITCCEPAKTAFGSAGFVTSGYDHWKRYFSLPAAEPMGLSGQGSIRRAPMALVPLRSNRLIEPVHGPQQSPA